MSSVFDCQQTIEIAPHFTIAGVPLGSMSPKMDGVLGRLQAGYNWQIGRAVSGWETDFGATGQRSTSSLIDFIPGVPAVPGTRGSPCIFEDGPGTPCQPGTGIPGTPGIAAVTGLVSYQNKLPWFGTVRGRVGVAATDRWLAYLTGGLAYANVSTSETLVAASARL
jgi:outer membrane immunogenic protein